LLLLLLLGNYYGHTSEEAVTLDRQEFIRVITSALTELPIIDRIVLTSDRRSDSK